MRDLGLVGLSADQDHVLFFADSGEVFQVRVDDSLRAAIRSAPRAPARGNRDRRQVGTSMDAVGNALRPRDIQARIRAGEAPEAVAAVAELAVERVMAYAVPVLAEREHVCRQARRSGLRRKHASGPARQLGDAVDDHLRGTGYDPELASWDSWRREDGRWSVTVAASRGAAPATFLFDPPGRYVFAHDDAARALVGDEPPLSVEPEPDEPRMPTRLVSEPDELLAAVPDVPYDPIVPLEPVAPEPVEPRARVSALDRLRRQRAQTNDEPEDTARSDEPAGHPGDHDDVDAIARVLSGPVMAAAAEEQSAPEQNGAARKRRPRRASVPSWDEIMFGSKSRG